MRTKLIATPLVSDWIVRVEHDYHGVLTVVTKQGTYRFRAPVETGRQAQRICARQAAGSRVSIGKWVNTAVIGMYPRIS